MPLRPAPMMSTSCCSVVAVGMLGGAEVEAGATRWRRQDARYRCGGRSSTRLSAERGCLGSHPGRHQKAALLNDPGGCPPGRSRSAAWSKMRRSERAQAERRRSRRVDARCAALGGAARGARRHSARCCAECRRSMAARGRVRWCRRTSHPPASCPDFRVPALGATSAPAAGARPLRAGAAQDAPSSMQQQGPDGGIKSPRSACSTSVSPAHGIGGRTRPARLLLTT